MVPRMLIIFLVFLGRLQRGQILHPTSVKTPRTIHKLALATKISTLLSWLVSYKAIVG